MNMFDYVMVLASVIIGLAVSQLLQGVGRIVKHPSEYRPYWVHLLWVVVVFQTSIFWWWWEFRLSARPLWTFDLYLFVLAFAVVLYLIADHLFPQDMRGYEGLKDYYYSRGTWFFGLNLLFTMLDVADTLVKGKAHFVSLGWQYPAGIVVQSALFVACMLSRNERLHGVAVIFLLAFRTQLAFQSFHTMQ